MLGSQAQVALIGDGGQAGQLEGGVDELPPRASACLLLRLQGQQPCRQCDAAAMLVLVHLYDTDIMTALPSRASLSENGRMAWGTH